MQAGATSLMPPTDMEYGERSGAIEDPGGNHWYLATAFGPSYVPEGSQNMMPHFSLRGAKKMIDFLTQAFAGETLALMNRLMALYITQKFASAPRSSRWVKLTASGNHGRCISWLTSTIATLRTSAR